MPSLTALVSNTGTVQARAGYGVKLSAHNLREINLAELRTVNFVLGLSIWIGEDLDKVVLAGDSEYVVVKGSQPGSPNFQTPWRWTAQRTPAEKRYLWEVLLAAMREQFTEEQWSILADSREH